MGAVPSGSPGWPIRWQSTMTRQSWFHTNPGREPDRVCLFHLSGIHALLLLNRFCFITELIYKNMEVAIMVGKCANPECNAEFRYFNKGQIFSFQIRNPQPPCHDVPAAICQSRPKHAIVYFWLWAMPDPVCPLLRYCYRRNVDASARSQKQAIVAGCEYLPPGRDRCWTSI
jgi:hypothetical protein